MAWHGIAMALDWINVIGMVLRSDCVGNGTRKKKIGAWYCIQRAGAFQFYCNDSRLLIHPLCYWGQSEYCTYKPLVTIQKTYGPTLSVLLP